MCFVRSRRSGFWVIRQSNKQECESTSTPGASTAGASTDASGSRKHESKEKTQATSGERSGPTVGIFDQSLRRNVAFENPLS